MKPSRLLASLVLAGFGSAAVAHPGHESAGFFSGFGHPFGGLDHLLAMLAVGWYAARQHGAARWALPSGFVAAMLVGAGVGAAGLALPMVESGIAVSVLALGLAIAFAAQLRIAAALPLVAGFALFHGYAHHTEIGDAAFATYASGFAIATAILHGTGFIVGRCLPETPVAAGLRRAAGGAIAVAGAALIGG
ncbi:MAG: HupE/UreJ family protein [Burkholderiales bacterium]|nr:MAG: HupE/UreJ family protein [Burkholderiales bacterium]